jgi:hypothetical protein
MLLAAMRYGSERAGAHDLEKLERLVITASGTAWRKVFNLCVLAELCGAIGKPETGQQILASIGAMHRDAFYAAEIVRLEGELILISDGSAIAGAERLFEQALQIARSRGEKSLELRAAMSLARLRARQKRIEEAYRVLSPAYEWFKEGFDTGDLRAAGTLLSELEGKAPAAR